jgi:hypothetical protein
MAGAALLIVLAAGLQAQDKEETLKGRITCAKCELMLPGATKCATVIKVKDAVYYFDAAAHKKYHGGVCKEGKDGTVTGTVKKDGDKLVVTVKSLEYK